MQVNDIRKFPLDPAKPEKCELLNGGTSQSRFYVKKERKDFFQAYADERLEEPISFGVCSKSEVGYVETNLDAKNCGIATAICFVCMIDLDVGATKLDIEDEFRNNRQLQQQVKDKCAKLFKYKVKAREEDYNGAIAYFSAAIASGYNFVYVADGNGIKQYISDEAKTLYINKKLMNGEGNWIFCMNKSAKN